jgi:hypothetical protein
MNGTVVSFDRRARATDAVEVTLPIALGVWSHWSLDIPPTGSTGNPIADKCLAEAFNDLAALPDHETRLRWIESNVFAEASYWAPSRTTAAFTDTLLEWWFEIYAEQTGVLN